ncbi:hypothetical protein EYC84_004136 [Monilinia fructicola]|uniref:Uncharacterized protein n=1 Tax=Monilinia fructicola TaxID=38448 RepID=A0A5M9K247_MONFR|nr:hypothetical protein EYC84_004136 [Monilinia fructicola]
MHWQQVRGAGDQLMSIRLLSGLASSSVTNTVPASAASQQVAENDELLAAPKVAAVDGPTARNQSADQKGKMVQESPITTDHSSRHRKKAYAVLFERILVFAGDYFGFQELHQGFHEPWALDMPDEFLRYAELVAEPDPVVGGWNEMLISTETRKFLIVGIIVRILEVKVFAPNLWGNTKEGEEFLHGLDRALLNSEGYSRQELRSKSIRTLLGGASLTPNFHVDCSILTAQVMLLFAPLFNYLTLLPALPTVPKNTPPSCKHPGPFPKPSFKKNGPKIMHCWKLNGQKLRAIDSVMKRAHRLDSIAGRLAIQKLEAAQNRLAMHRPPFYTHRASVKISVWPNTRRYWAGSGKPGGDMDGQSIFSLTNAGAIFYFKETDRPIEPLFDFVARKKKTFRGRHQRARDVMGIIGFLALGIILCLLYLLGPTAVLDSFKWIPTRLTAYLQSYIRRGRDEVYRGYGYFGAPGAARFESARKNPFEAFRDTAGKATDKVKEGYSAGASRAGDVYGKYARRSGH